MQQLGIILSVLVLYVSAQQKDYTGHQLITATASTQEQLELLASLEQNAVDDDLEFWSGPSKVIPNSIRVSPKFYGKLRKQLNDAGIEFVITNPNIQDLIAAERTSMAENRVRVQLSKLQTKGHSCMFAQLYCTEDQIKGFLLVAPSIYGSHVDVASIGKTNNSKDIYRVKITNGDGVPKPAIWIEAGTHAREWIAIASALNLIDVLGRKAEGSKEMLDKYDWYIVPVHNPDGYSYSHTNDRLWRKNRDLCSKGHSVTGTDLNRNWDIAHGGAGTDTRCTGITWPGDAPFSALETSALRDAVLSTPNVNAFFSIHAYSQLFLLPYGYTSQKPADYQHLYWVGEQMMAALKATHGRQFIIGTPPDILYAASGGAYDYFYTRGIKYSFTYELRPAAANPGFLLPESEIPMASEELLASLRQFAALNL